MLSAGICEAVHTVMMFRLDLSLSTFFARSKQNNSDSVPLPKQSFTQQEGNVIASLTITNS